jgi:Na+/H+ antiporter NhaB
MERILTSMSVAVSSCDKAQLSLLLLLQSALQPLVRFRPGQLSIGILSRTVLQSAVASGTSNPHLGGEPGI